MRYIARMRMFAAKIAEAKLLFAYLDLNSGSILIQLLVAAVVGVLATLRFLEIRLLSFLGIRQQEY